MDAEVVALRIDPSELKYTASRSSGPGGQNVNKVNTRIELRFNVNGSSSFTDREKEMISSKLGKRISNEGDLIVVSQSERTQLQNRKKAEETLFRLIAKALTVKAERKPTKPSAASRQKRMDEKKKRGLIKSLRKDPGEI